MSTRSRCVDRWRASLQRDHGLREGRHSPPSHTLQPVCAWSGVDGGHTLAMNLAGTCGDPAIMTSLDATWAGNQPAKGLHSLETPE
jgi:hypothetical protein